MYSARNPGANEQCAEPVKGPLTYQTHILYTPYCIFSKIGTRDWDVMCTYVCIQSCKFFYVFLIRKRCGVVHKSCIKLPSHVALLRAGACMQLKFQ